MSRVTLYHAPQTRSTGVRVLVEELGADVDVVVLDLKAGDNRSPSTRSARSRPCSTATPS